MFTYNITFVVSPDKEQELLEYIHRSMIPLLFRKENSAQNPELRKVVEAGGEKPGPDHGLSIALSATLPTEETAHFWNENILLPALRDFNNKFGCHSLFFVTLLKNLSI